MTTSVALHAVLTSLMVTSSSGGLQEEDPSFDLGSRLGEESVEVQLEIRTPERETRQWREVPRQGGSSGESSRSGLGPPAQGGGRGSNGGGSARSAHYCVDDAGEADPACTRFMAAMPTFITNFTCSMGQRLADTQEQRGFAPREVCPEDEPAAEIEQVFAEDVPDQTESQWELILTQIPGEVEQAFASLPIQGGTVAFEEELLGFGYVNQHTNVFAEVSTQTFTESLLGIEVEIRAIPVEYRFNYGDGTTRTTSDPGGPATRQTSTGALDIETPTSHVYQDTGTYPVSVTTTFIGEYRLPGGAWTPISGSTSVEASPGVADIWRLSHRHVSGACQDANYWGCSGPVELAPGDKPPKIFVDEYDSNGRYIGPTRP